MSNTASGFKRAIGIVLGVITMLVLIALFVVLVMAPIPNIWGDKVAASDNAIDQAVSPTQSQTHCEAPLGVWPIPARTATAPSRPLSAI